MSLRAAPSAPIPEETVRVAHAAFPKGTMCMQMRDTLGLLYEDSQFVALFSSTGQPAEAPARLALVLVLQFAEGLSDRHALAALTCAVVLTSAALERSCIVPRTGSPSHRPGVRSHNGGGGSSTSTCRPTSTR